MSDNRRYFRLFTIACVIASLALSLNSCCKSNIPDSEKADLVVYGNVYTADCLSNGEIIRAEAIAIKDGKFEYVGNEDGVRGYISDKTEVFRCHKSQMVLPGLTDGHAHYILDALIDAFAAGYSKDVRNSLCHMRNIDAPDYKKMAESCNIACDGGRKRKHFQG